MSRAVSRCQHCQHQILNTFAALAGLTIRPVRQTNSTAFLRPPQQSATRALSSSSRTFQAASSHSTDTTSENATTSASSTPDPSIPSPPEPNDTSIPWYLQVDTPLPPTPTTPPHLLSTQDLPPLPSNPPPLLSPLLTHLSTSIGLDNLTLLDLRDIHPPPALGSNLLMVLGTARSYKHLNTSADRFCRWLRTTYKLRPYADGLLGRNEMKLKLRRKARRLKLAQSVGNTVAMGSGAGADDGITTGWICVNLGSLEGFEMPEEEVDQTQEGDGEVTPAKMSAEEQEEMRNDEEYYENPVDEREGENSGYIGFGSRSMAPKIVVQMFTEEKRLEMDLEGLWDIRKERRSVKDEKVTSAVKKMLEAREAAGYNEAPKENVFKPWGQ